MLAALSPPHKGTPLATSSLETFLSTPISLIDTTCTMVPSPIDTSFRKRTRPDELDLDEYATTSGRRSWIRTDEDTFEAVEDRDEHYYARTASPSTSSAQPSKLDFYDRCPISASHPSLAFAQTAISTHSSPRTGKMAPPPPPTPTSGLAPRPGPSLQRKSNARQRSAPPPPRRRPAAPTQIDRSHSAMEGLKQWSSQADAEDEDMPMEQKERPLPPSQIPMPPAWIVERLVQRRSPYYGYREPSVPPGGLNRVHSRHSGHPDCASCSEGNFGAPHGEYTALQSHSPFMGAHSYGPRGGEPVSLARDASFEDVEMGSPPPDSAADQSQTSPDSPPSENATSQIDAPPVHRENIRTPQDMNAPRQSHARLSEDEDVDLPRWETLSDGSRASSPEMPIREQFAHRATASRRSSPMSVGLPQPQEDELASEDEREPTAPKFVWYPRGRKTLAPWEEALVTFRLEYASPSSRVCSLLTAFVQRLSAG